jgi:xanthosine phosphorylase
MGLWLLVYKDTNAAGSLTQDIKPGQLVSIRDHINFSFGNPLAGPNDDEFGERFVAMEQVYDPSLHELLQSEAQKGAILLHNGIYVGVLGPSFETAAEIRAFRMLGGDVVGMSTIPEVIIAKHCGLKIAAISAVTNFGTGLSTDKNSHEVTLQFAKLAAENLTKLIVGFAGRLT